MSRDISTAEKVRLAWITELRRQGDRQCHGSQTGEFAGRKDNTVCALRLLAELTGGEWKSLTGTVASRAGLTERQGSIVVMLNDGCRRFGDHFLPADQFQRRKHTFSEIADVVEGWFAHPEAGITKYTEDAFYP